MNDPTQPPDVVISTEAAQRRSGETRFSTPNANINSTQTAENASAAPKGSPIEEGIISSEPASRTEEVVISTERSVAEKPASPP